MAQARAVETRARQRQHVERKVDAEPALKPGPEQLEHAARTSAKIEQRAERPIGESRLDFGLNRRVGGVQAPYPIPLGGVLAEIGLRRGRAGGTHGGQAFAIADHHAIVGIELRCERARKVGFVAMLGETEKRPRTFAKSHHQTRLGQQPQMSRDARLRLAQDFGELGDGEFGFGQQCKQAQPRFLACGLEHGRQFVEREAILGHTSHINISLCRGKAAGSRLQG